MNRVSSDCRTVCDPRWRLESLVLPGCAERMADCVRPTSATPREGRWTQGAPARLNQSCEIAVQEQWARDATPA